MKVCLVLLLLGAVTANPTPPPESGDSGSSSDADSTATIQQPQVGQAPMMNQPGQPRPGWLNYNNPMMMNQPQQQQGPYISGWNSGAQAGFATLPATIGNTWRSQQPQTTAYGGMSPSYARGGMAYSTGYQQQQPMTNYYSNQQWSSSSNNQNSWRAPQPQGNYGSVPAGSSGIQDVTGQQQQQWGNARSAPMGNNMMWSQPAQTWSMASYAAPSQSAWQNTWSNGNGNGNSGMWYPAPAVAAERVTAEGSADSDTGIKKVVNAVKTIASNNIAAAANTVGGWTAGQPAWRKSYTPVGQSGCYSKCRPRMRPLPAAPAPAPAPGQWNTPKPMIGYQSSCRTGCNMRPSCGLRAPAPQWSGSTMVCGQRRAGGNAQFLQQPATSWQQSAMNNNVDGMRLYGPRGGYVSNIDMGSFSWGGQQPQQQQNSWGMNTMGRRMSAALTKKSNDEDSDDSDSDQ